MESLWVAKSATQFSVLILLDPSSACKPPHPSVWVTLQGYLGMANFRAHSVPSTLPHLYHLAGFYHQLTQLHYADDTPPRVFPITQLYWLISDTGWDWRNIFKWVSSKLWSSQPKLPNSISPYLGSSKPTAFARNLSIFTNNQQNHPIFVQALVISHYYCKALLTGLISHKL